MIIHFILHGETLESIAEEIKLENPKYLKEYHNQRCAREDYIDEELIPRKKLLIPNISEIQKYNQKNDAPFKSPEQNPVIVFKPEDLDKKYSVGIVEKIQKGENTFDHPVFYNVSLKWIKYEENRHIFHFSKLSFYNRKDSIMADLAEECIKSINPLEISTNSKGEVINVSVPKETLENFNEIKDRLLGLYPGEYSKMYIEEFEYAVLNQEIFSQRMKEDLFIKIWFAPFRNKFTDGKSYYQIKVTDENIPVTVIQKVETGENESEIILVQKNQSSESEMFTGKYILDKETGLIKNSYIDFEISHNSVKNTTRFLIEEIF
jgi:hypothetical protein